MALNCMATRAVSHHCGPGAGPVSPGFAVPVGAARTDPADVGLAAVLSVRRRSRPSRGARMRHLGPRPPPVWTHTMTLATRLSVNNQA
jgi:hypothetical protein